MMANQDHAKLQSLEQEISELKAELADRTRMDAILAEAFASSPDSISVADIRKNQILVVNEASVNLLGYSRQEWVNQDPDSHNTWVDKEEKDKFFLWLRNKQPNESFEARLRRKDGSEFSALISGNLINYGDELLSVTTIRDITTIRETEQQLEFSNEKFSQLFQFSYAPMLLLGVQPLQLIEFNRAAVKLLEYEFEIRRIEDMTRLWVNPDDLKQFNHEITVKGYCSGMETSFLSASGREIPVILAGRILDISGQLCLLLHFNDLTSQRASEAHLQRNTARLELAQEISHVGDFHWSLETQTISTSKECARLLGIAPTMSDLDIDAALALIHGDDRPLFLGSQKNAYNLNFRLAE